MTSSTTSRLPRTSVLVAALAAFTAGWFSTGCISTSYVAFTGDGSLPGTDSNIPGVDSATDSGPGMDSGLDSGGPTDSGDAGCCPASCPFGCDVASCSCLELVPSNNIDPAWINDVAVNDAFPSTPEPGYLFDTVTGRIDRLDMSGTFIGEYRAAGTGTISGVRFETVPQANPCAPTIGVWSFASIDVPANVWVALTGANAAALAARGDIHVVSGGSILAGADHNLPGPGGGIGGAGTFNTLANPGTGCGAGQHGTLGGSGEDSGGAGGGFGGTGGPGGLGNGGLAGGTPGTPYCTPDLVPLCAGSGGGGASTDFGGAGTGGYGGGGGGALQLVSLSTVTIELGAVVWAGGGGCGNDVGGGVLFGAERWAGGGGGGSGGAILIEAATVTVGGKVAANGGAGCAADESVAAPDGTTDDARAPGPPSTGIDGVGEAGGDGSGGTFPDGEIGGDNYNGSGGGGGAGRIRINSLAGTGFTPSGLLSPHPTTNLTTFGAVTLQ